MSNPSMPFDPSFPQHPDFLAEQFAIDPHDPQLAALQKHPLTEFPLIFIAGLVWGLLVAFSLYVTGQDDSIGGSAMMVDTMGMVLALILVLVGGGKLITAMHSIMMWAFIVYTVVAVISSIVGLSNVYFILRALVVLPALATILAIAGGGWGPVRAFRLGLTISGLFFVAFHLFKIDYGRLLDPHYRLMVFLSPNGVGYVAMITGLSVLDYIIQRFRRSRNLLMLALLFGLLTACTLVCIATKSRTAALGFITGGLVSAVLALRLRKLLVALIFVALAALVVVDMFAPNAESTISDLYQLSGHQRDISTATGRFDVWRRAIDEGFLTNPAIGGGLGSENLRLGSFGNVHNALLTMLVETGLLGTFPIVLLLVVCAYRSKRLRRDARFHFAIAIWCAGMTESGAEIMLFSLGNPAGLLFILSVAALITKDLAAAPGLPVPYSDEFNPPELALDSVEGVPGF